MTYEDVKLVAETLYKYMIVGSKETVEYSVPHIPFVDGVERVGVSFSMKLLRKGPVKPLWGDGNKCGNGHTVLPKNTALGS